jgi:hypothetical protein
MREMIEFKVVETPAFVASADRVLPSVQREALYYLLVMNPLVGAENADNPGTFSLRWGDKEQYRIHYCLSSKGDEIFLYAIEEDPHDVGGTKKAKSSKPKQDSEVVKDLRRAGIGVGLKELWDLFKQLF